jgi:hypothetical protein
MMEKLLPPLLEAKAVSELNWCIKHFTDIPERSLVQILLFCLENVTKTEEQQPFRKLLNAVLHAPFSDVCLMPSLRTTPFHHTLALLHHLAEEIEADESEVKLCNLVEWTSLLLDAHYQQYLLSGDPEVLELLHRIRGLVTDQVKVIRNMFFESALTVVMVSHNNLLILHAQIIQE